MTGNLAFQNPLNNRQNRIHKRWATKFIDFLKEILSGKEGLGCYGHCVCSSRLKKESNEKQKSVILRYKISDIKVVCDNFRDWSDWGSFNSHFV